MEPITDTERLQVYQNACALLENTSYEAKVYEDYSGRGMDGRTVPGIYSRSAPGPVIGWAVSAAAFNFLTDRGEEFLYYEDFLGPMEEFIPTRSDDLGKDIIYY